ncbi:MAG: hypothetical protein AABX04_01650 [Nanoarchaeota archaeon]
MEQKKRTGSRCTSRGSFNYNYKDILSWNKQAQVTIFIIAGIVLVFAFAGILYFTRTTTLQEIQTAEEPVSVTVPQEFKPIQKYTEDCLYKLGKRGIQVLGQQGGYIYPDLAGKYSADDPSSFDGVLIGTQQVPYWYYNKQPNSAKVIELVSLRPELYVQNDPMLSVEAQLARYVKEQLNDCLNNYSAFQSQFQIELPDGGIKEVKARVGETGINFILVMKVKATQSGNIQEMDQFGIKVPIHFKHYYDVASMIMQAQQNYSFLERQGMELVSIYSRKDSGYLAPISDESFERVSLLQWEVPDLQEKFRGLLISYIPMLRFLGSSNFYRATFPEGAVLAQKVIDNMVLTLNGAEDLDVSFDYLGWQPYLKVNSKDGKVKPEDLHVSFWSFDYSQQRFDTHYDISYPTLVTISDKNAFDGQGYNFVFALESNIRNNKPAKPNESWSETPPQVSIPLPCDEKYRDSGIVKTVVVDSFTKESLEMVKIGFSIPDQQSCEIGVTDTKGELATTYPSVYGGVMSLMKPEYLTNFYPVNTYKFNPNSTNLIGYSVEGIKSPKAIEMHRLKTINVTIKKKEFKECVGYLSCLYGAGDYIVDCSDKGKEVCFFDKSNNSLKLINPTYMYDINMSRSKHHYLYYVDQEKELNDSEEALITLERVDDPQLKVTSTPFTAVVKLSGKGSSEIELVPGKYNVIATITGKGEYYVAPEKRCARWSKSDTCMEMSEVKIDKYLLGKLELNQPSNRLEITPEQLYTAQSITFFIPVIDLMATPITFGDTDHPLNGRVTEGISKGAEMDRIFQFRPELYNSILPRFEGQEEQKQEGKK